MAIEFHDLPKELNSNELIKHINTFIKQKGGVIDKLSISFVKREIMAAVHQQFLDNYETDTMTFNYGTIDNIISEVFISPWFVKRSAEALGVPFRDELLRVVGHGVLHSMGYKDYSEKEKERMGILEDEFINLFHSSENNS